MISSTEDPVLGILLDNGEWLKQGRQQESIIQKTYSDLTNFQFFENQNVIFAIQKYSAGATYHDLLLELHFSYEYKPDLLQKLLSFEPDSDFDKTMKLKIVLHSFVALCSEKYGKDIKIILKALFSVLKFDSNKQALNAIYYVLRDEDDNSDIEFLRERISYLKILFTDYSDFAKQIQDILVVFLRDLCARNKQGASIDEDQQDLIKFICEISQNHLDFFKQEVASGLIYCVTGYLVKLDKYALILFHSLSPFIDETSAMSITMLLPMSIRNLIESQPPFLIPKDIDGNVISAKSYIEQYPPKPLISYKKTLTGQYTHPPRETFKSGIDITRPMYLTDRPNCSCLVRPDVYSKLLMIGDGVKTHPSVVKALFEWVSRTVKESADSPHFFDLVAAFICLFRLCVNNDLVPLFWETMYNTLLFDSRINMFDKGCQIPLFDQLRAFIFSDVANNGFPFLPRMVKTFLEKPELVAEMFRRIIDEFDLIDPRYLSSYSLINNTCSIMVYFQLLDFECPEDQIPLVESTRSTLLGFILQVLSDTEIAAQWFSCRFFLTSFLELIFEPVLRKHVIGVVRNYLAKAGTVKDEVMNEVMNVLSITFSRFPDERDVIIGCDVVEMINEVMSLNKPTMNTFIKLNDLMCNAITNLDSTPTNDAFLIQALHFLALVSSILKLKSSYLQSITEAIKTIEKDQISPQVLTNLKQISAGNVISSVMPFYVIKQPKVLKTLINVTKNTSAYADCTAFLLSLIEFTYQNSIIMNTAGIDMLLLEIIDSMKGGDIDKNVLDNTFSIITQISMIVSSTLVVHRFLSLMFPLEGKILSKYHQYFVKKLTDITTYALRSPPAFIPIHVQNCVEIRNLTQEFLGDEFGVYFWLYADRAVSQVRASILEIYDLKGKGLNLFISSGALLVTCMGKKMESTTQFDVSLPRGQWCFVAINAKKNEKGRVSLNARINEKISRKVEFKYKWICPGPLRVIIGSMMSSNQMDEYDVSPILLSNVTFFKDPKIEEIKSEIESGPRVSTLSNIILSLSFIDREGIVHPNIESIDKNISATIVGGNIECKTTFIDVLCSLCKVKALIPLFSMVDLKTKTGEIFAELPILLIDLLSTTLSISTSVQKSFCNSGGMEIISYLIQDSATFPHTYAMYIRMYQIMSSITERSLQVSVIENILCNFSLLQLYDSMSQLRIIKHWRRVILQVYPNQFAEVISMRMLIYAMNNYYDKGTNVETIRQELMNLIVEISSISINEDDILALVSEAISTNKVQRVKRVLRCLSDIFACEEGTCVDTLKFRITHIVLLNNLISTGDDEVLLFVTNIIASIHRLNLLPSLPAQMHFELIMQNITPNCCTHDSAVELATMSNNLSNAILPLCLYVAINVGDAAMFDVLEELTPRQLSFHDLIWVVAIIDRSPSDIGKKGFNFLILCEADWIDVVNAITIVSKSLGSDPHSLINEYLSLIYTEVSKKCIPHEVDKFFTLAFNEIFFHTLPTSSPMEREYKASPFVSQTMSEEESSDDCGSEGGAFQTLRTRSMMSRSFLFIPGENQSDELDCSQESVTKSLSQSTIELAGMPKITLDKRQLSYNKEAASPPSLKNHSQLLRNQTVSPRSQPFLYRPPTEAKLTFSMNDLYSRIEMFAKKKKESLFSVRRDKNGRWLDIDLAILCLKLYPKVNTPLHFGFMVLIADILIRYQPLQTERFLRAINPTPSMMKNCRNQLSMLKFDIQKLNLKTSVKFMDAITANEELKMEALQAMATSRSPIYTYRLYNNAENIMNESLKMVKMQTEFINFENVENIGFAMKETRKFIINEQRIQREQQVMWSKLWNSMTMELALWEGATQKKTVVTFVRDFHLCAHFAPIREKFPVTTDKLIPKKLSPTPGNIECTVIEPNKERKCSIEVTRHGITLISEYGTKNIPKKQIRFILPIDRHNNKFSIEAVYYTGKIHIFEFTTIESYEKVMQSCRTHFSSIEFIAQQEYNPTDFLTAINAEERWRDGLIPNFEYLMLINIAAGRVFADRSLYPIFPWVITDFTSKTLDLRDKSVYRDFSKRIGTTEDPPLTSDHITKMLTCKQSLESILSNSKDGNFELIPEFFCYPELISNIIELPPWAESAQDFVYKNRVALESIHVSSHLHEWIDLVFGFKLQDNENENIGIMPLQLFTKSHQEKGHIHIPQPTVKKGLAFNLELTGIIMAHITGETKTTMDILLVLDNGSVKKVQIDFIKQKYTFLSNLSIVPFITDNTPIVDKSVLPAPHVDGTIAPINNGFVSITGSGPVIGITTNGRCKILKSMFGFVRSVSSNGNHIAAVCTDMTTRVWDVTNVQTATENPKCVVSSYRDYSICSDVSEAFGIVATGTRDGSIQICSLTGSVQKIINLCGRKPLKIAISKGLGYIVVYAERTDEVKRSKEIIVYTINGLFIGRKPIADISCWTSWEDHRGIDYLGLAFENGKLQMFEVGNLTLSSPLRFDTTPVWLEISSTHSMIVSTSSKGSLILIPINV